MVHEDGADDPRESLRLLLCEVQRLGDDPADDQVRRIVRRWLLEGGDNGDEAG